MVPISHVRGDRHQGLGNAVSHHQQLPGTSDAKETYRRQKKVGDETGQNDDRGGGQPLTGRSSAGEIAEMGDSERKEIIERQI